MSSWPTFGVIINPTSGRGSGAGVGVQLIASLEKAGAKVFDLSAVDSQTAASNAQVAIDSSKIDALVVVGGDGTGRRCDSLRSEPSGAASIRVH